MVVSNLPGQHLHRHPFVKSRDFLDRERGLIEVEAGIQWPELIRSYLNAQVDSAKQWGIAQKQTGADTFTLGGSLSSNVHGRGLTMKPLISNIDGFTLIDAEGKRIRCRAMRTKSYSELQLVAMVCLD